MEREIKKTVRRRSKSEGLPDAGIEGESKARGTDGAPCKSCNHPNRAKLEQLALDGASWESIARAIEVGDKSIDPTGVAVHRHVQKCIPEIMRRRMDAILEKDDLTADLVMRHIKGALRQSEESADMVFEEDEHGIVREAAQGRSAAIRTRVDCARAAGELIGLFQSNKIEMLLRSADAQEVLNKIVDALCQDCALKVREILGEENG